MIHVIGWYFPESTGGSEVYVDRLCGELRQLGHEVCVAVPHPLLKEELKTWNETAVYRYSAGLYSSQQPDLECVDSVESLCRWVKAFKPDVVHFHSWTSGCGYWHFRRVHEAGFKTVLTIHTPSLFCPRQTMLRWGHCTCEGQLKPVRCAACYFQKQGLYPFLGLPLSALASLLVPQPQSGNSRWVTAFNFPSHLKLQKSWLEHTWRMSDRMVAVCGWIREALLRNGCPASKISLVRQGAPFFELTSPAFDQRKSRPLKLGYAGRLDPVKGVDLLIEAFCELPFSDRIELEIKGIPGDPSYLQDLKSLASGDPRISFLEAGDGRETMAWMSALDALVVPSRCLETGPLVAYEALGLRVPVIGADHGGIAEMVIEGRNGLLFEPLSIEALRKVLLLVVKDRSQLDAMRLQMDPPRRMDAVAREMEEIYDEILV